MPLLKIAAMTLSLCSDQIAPETDAGQIWTISTEVENRLCNHTENEEEWDFPDFQELDQMTDPTPQAFGELV